MNSILLALPVPFRSLDGKLHIEAQAANGLDRWADNFGRVVVACPLISEDEAQRRASWRWVPCDSLEHRARIRLVELPTAWTIKAFAGHYGRVRRLFAEELIPSCQYLQFAIGGMVGDWASVAALEARRMGRSYAVWTDRVESDVVRITAARRPAARRWLSWANAWLMKHYERRVIRHARLGLLHGAETYEAYAHLPEHAFLTHDVHTKPEDRIPNEELRAKCERASESGRPLKIGYAGRATAMKAPSDWLEVLLRLRDAGVAFEAAWLGDGELLAEMRAFVTRHALDRQVSLPGFVSERHRILAFLRSCDVLLFTHVTPESPRIILEALVSGTPVVGYANGYVADVVGPVGRRLLTPVGDAVRLAELAAGLAQNREVLVEAIGAAARAGEQYDDAAVFRHRSELIKQYL
jgi:glycosyltransferase involved in cell wall biosynthesis